MFYHGFHANTVTGVHSLDEKVKPRQQGSGMGRIFISIVMVMAMAQGAFGADKTVVLATLTDFAPYCFPKENSVFVPDEHIPPGSDSVQLQGYSWDVVRESFHAMGYTIRLLVVPWERGTHYLANGKVDFIFPANKTVEREREYAFSTEYVDQIETVVYMQKDVNFTWWGLESLEGLTIGYVRGWSYGKLWEGISWINKESTDSIAQGVEMLGKGRLAGLAGYKRPYDHVLKMAGLTHEFKIIGQFDTIDEYLMGRSNKQSRLMLNAFDAGKQKIRESAVLSRIEERWQ